MPPSCAFVIFGISGDLAARKLIPALYTLHCDQKLHPETEVVGFARRDWDADKVRDVVKQAITTFVDKVDEEALDSFASRFSFVQGNYTDADTYQTLAEHLSSLQLDNRIFYTSTPPSTYTAIAKGLAHVKLNQADGWSRLIIEKPFGIDLTSAQSLNQTLLNYFQEEQLYRIDHYLAKETAQNLAVLRFANALFEPIWNNRYIDHVQITMAEKVSIEGRGDFYEEAGVVRDVLQNHLLQLLALVAMEPPAQYAATAVRNEKVKVFQAMRCVNLSDAVMGQYTGTEGRPSYRQEEGVASNSRQATYVAVECRIDNWRWAGVPFFIRSGKSLKGKASEIVLYLKKPPHVPFVVNSNFKTDRIVFRLVPNEGIAIHFNAKIPGQGTDMQQVRMDFMYDGQFERPTPDAYETLLTDAMQGDATLFMRADEVEGQWRIIDPLLSTWEQSQQSPAFYQAGTWGPEEANQLLAQKGRTWHSPRV